MTIRKLDTAAKQLSMSDTIKGSQASDKVTATSVADMAAPAPVSIPVVPVASASATGAKSNVYMVNSQLSLNQLHAELSRYGTIGLLRIVLDRDGRETTRNIAIFHDDVYQRLLAEGFGNRSRWNQDFSVHPFEVKEFDLPGSGKTQTLFVPVPNELLTKDGVVRGEITDKLQHLVDWEVLPADCWKLTIPLKSRERGGIRGGFFISFRGLTMNHIALARVALTDTRWDCLADPNQDNHNVFRCYWARDRDADGKPKKDDTPANPAKPVKERKANKPRKGRKGPKSPKSPKADKPAKADKPSKSRKSPRKSPRAPAEPQTVAMPVMAQPTLLTRKDAPAVEVAPPTTSVVAVPAPTIPTPTVVVPAPVVAVPAPTIPTPTVAVLPPVVSAVPLPPVVRAPVLPPPVVPPVATPNATPSPKILMPQPTVAVVLPPVAATSN